MKNRVKLFGIYLPIYLVILAAATALKTAACFTSLNKYGYFTDPLIIKICAALLALGSVFFLSYIWTARKDLKLVPSFSSPANYIPTAAVAVSLVFVAIYLFSYAKTALSKWYDSFILFRETVKYYPALKMPLPTSSSLVALLAAVFAILSIIYFIFTGIIEKKISLRRANYGILTLLFLCLYVAYIYFDKSLPINAPNKISDQMAYLSTTLFFLYETRLSLGREKWRHYIAFGFIASLLTAFSSIPALIIYFAEGIVISNSIYESLLTFSFFVFITAKLLLTGSLIEDKKSPIAEGIIAAASKREEEINPSLTSVEESPENTVQEEPDENQITITDIGEREELPDSTEGFGDAEEKDGIQ